MAYDDERLASLQEVVAELTELATAPQREAMEKRVYSEFPGAARFRHLVVGANSEEELRAVASELDRAVREGGTHDPVEDDLNRQVQDAIQRGDMDEFIRLRNEQAYGPAK